MKDEELMRRISDALDAPGGIEADEALRAALAEDPEAARYAEALSAIDEALGQLGRDRPEPDWEAMLERIERGLDRDLEGLVDIGDPTAPPDFEDEAAPALPRVAAAAPVAAPVAAKAAKAASGGEVVDLAARRKQRRQVFSLIGGLAAAAAVGLGITAGLSMNDTAPMAGFAMEEAAPAAPSVATVPADMEMPAAAPEPEPAAEAPPPMAFAMGEAEADEPADDSAVTAAGAFQAARAVEAPRARGAAPSPDPAMDVLAEGFGGGRAGSGGGGAGVGYAVPAERATGSSTATPAQQPTRVEVVNALNEVADDVAACMRQTREVAQVRVRVNGSTGAVQSVTVQPPFRGAEAACIVRAVRGASMPTSASPSYEVVHAYHPAPIAGGSLAPTAPAARRARRPASPARSAPPSLRDQADVLSPWAE